MSEIDKQQLYGDYRDSAKRQERLYLKAAHKALDIADDDMNIQANRYGMGPVGVAGVALIASLIPSIVIGLFVNRTAPSPPAPPQAVKPIDLELRWKVIDGKMTQEIVPVEPGK